MTLLWISGLWVMASAAVALLPVRHQYIPGLGLVLAAPVLIAAIWAQAGWLVGLAALAAFASMYRNPLRSVWARLRRRPAEVPQ